jgi:hypothetical protein
MAATHAIELALGVMSILPSESTDVANNLLESTKH